MTNQCMPRSSFKIRSITHSPTHQEPNLLLVNKMQQSSRCKLTCISTSNCNLRSSNHSHTKITTMTNSADNCKRFFVSVLLTVLVSTTWPGCSNQISALDTFGTNAHNSTNAARPFTNTPMNGAGSPTAINQPQILAAFSTPSQAINITHITYDPLYDTVYLGATNVIYQLNGSDLSEQHEQSTGPLNDSPSCGVTECFGFEDYKKPTQNVNKILVIDYQHQKLLACGSVRQGACIRYQLNNIAQKEDLIPMAVAANDDNSSTYAFIAPARYTYDPSTSGPAHLSGPHFNRPQQQQQQVLYVATTYTKAGQSRDLQVPAIGSRILDDGPNLMKVYENSFLDSARIDINSHLRDYFLVNYLYGFASSNYIYFITVQKKATSRDYEELGYHTRLARICITDSSYNSYTEIDLKCLPNKRRKVSTQARTSALFGSSQQQQPDEYPLLQDAILVDAGSQLLQSLAQNDQSFPNSADFLFGTDPSSGSSDDSKVLLGVFSSARDHTQHAGEHSALCAFSLSSIEERFNDNIHSCYTGKMQSRNMEYIAGNVQECPKSGQGGNVVNFCHETLKINGTLPIVSEASVQYYNTTLTSITATSYVNSNSKNIYSDQLANEISSLSMSKSSASIPLIPIASQISGNQQQQRQHTVVFMGTSNGHLKKVLLNNASLGLEFEDVQVDTNPILSDLHLHSSGLQLIAATPYKVMKLATHNCAQHSTCRECSQSRNPYCGWCSLRRSCTTRNECIAGSQPDQLAPTTTTTLAPRPQGSDQAKQLQQQQQQQQQPLKWISIDSAGKCIDLQSISPDKIPITSMGKVDLFIDRLPRLPKDHSYKCIFDRREQTPATLALHGLSCALPKVMHRPKIQPGRDHTIVDLAVRSSETNVDFLSGKITFFECQLHTTCKDCLTTNWGCNWCLNENICLFNTSKCEKTSPQARLDNNLMTASMAQLVSRSALASSTLAPIPQSRNAGLLQQRSGNTINQVNQCPTFDVGHKQDILIADGSERELTIKVKNMPQFKGNIQCIVEIENDKIPLRGKIEQDRVICENSTYSYRAEVGLLVGQLVVSYSENNIFIDRTNFTLYKCKLLGAYLNRPDCSLCQRIDQRFNCAWCSGSCNLRNRCTERPDDTCPPPRIDFVHPLTGPIQGGTRVTIEGSNLGQSFEDIQNRVSVGNVPCRPIEEEYKPSNKIVCITGPLMSKFSLTKQRFTSLDFDMGDVSLGDVMVGNKAGYSIGQSKFHFKSIVLRDHQPREGPQSGGTRITLTGMNLNIGSSIQVFLDELDCLVEQNSITAEQIVCHTSASRHPSRAIRQLRLIIDDAQIVKDDGVFYYTQDPVIFKISPLRSYLAGGRPINVYGANLTSVQLPRIAILDGSGKKINESACILQDDSRMQCPSPAVGIPTTDIEWNEQHVSSYEPQSLSSPSTPGWSSIVSGQPSVKLGQQQATLGFMQEDNFKFKLSFIMDNVARLRDFQSNYPTIASEIIYSADPKLYPFASPQYKTAQEISVPDYPPEHLLQQQQLQQSYQVDSDTYLLQPSEPMLVLYGENLRTAVSEYELTVTVGQDLCNLTQLSQTRIMCLMPLDHLATPTDEEGHATQRALPMVVVRIGFNLRFELGYVQYHPQLADMIMQAISNSSESLPYMRSTYPQYMPRENENIFRKISSFIMNFLLFLLYLALGTIALALIYSTFLHGYKLKKLGFYENEHRRIRAKMDSLERSIRGECRIASLALQSDLNELVRHVDLSGIPLLSAKQYVMKVFFPGINNHPLLVKNAPTDLTSSVSIGNMTEARTENPSYMMQVPVHNNLTLQHPLKTNADFPMEYFERLILTKPFLIKFINTLEAQPNFTIRDKVNVASLIMIILMQRLDYATDVLRTLLFQLADRSIKKSQMESMATIESELLKGSARSKSCRASNLLSGLPCNGKRTSRAAALGMVVGGSASSLMASTTVAAQMLLSRVGTKTSPLQPHNEYSGHNDCNAGAFTTISHNVSTTAFNQRNPIINTMGGRSSNDRPPRSPTATANNKRYSSETSAHLMLRQTDSVVEKMLTNWLALNMYDYFQGHVGKCLYMMFEALRSQLDRGPVESISGDAYYSLSGNKLLREPYISFELVNLYIIVDTEILQPVPNLAARNSPNLLLDGVSSYPNSMTHLYEGASMSNRPNNQTTSNTITLSLRVLDCDTISQVKRKILHGLYRNYPHSSRLGADHVDLSLRQQSLASGQTTGRCVTVILNDEDYSSAVTFNGFKRLNTLRHYGVTDQAIVMLNRTKQNDGDRVCQSNTRTTLTDMLDEHYNNPYSEIQYGQCGKIDQADTRFHQPKSTISCSTTNRWHLIRPDEKNSTISMNLHSNDSSPSSHSPSMMLLSSDANVRAQAAIQNSSNGVRFGLRSQQQLYYHPSSSSTSSTGNAIDTHSTSANSSSGNVTNLLMKGTRNEQPIYCQIGSTSGPHGQNAPQGNGYYCQIGTGNNYSFDYHSSQRSDSSKKSTLDKEQEQQIYLTRMLTSKGSVQNYIDMFFKTILNSGSDSNCQPHLGENNVSTVLCNDAGGMHRRGESNLSGSCPAAVKWLFDLLDEVAMENGITDESVVHSWKSNAFLIRFWANFVKNPNYVLDVDKSTTLDATLSVISQALMDSCSTDERKLNKECKSDRLLFTKDIPKYRELVRRFYQDIASMRPVSDQEIVKQMNSLSISNATRFDTNLALKELCVYAVNYGVELMGALNDDYTCQQLGLSQKLEQCFRSFTIFEAYQ